MLKSKLSYAFSIVGEKIKKKPTSSLNLLVGGEYIFNSTYQYSTVHFIRST